MAEILKKYVTKKQWCFVGISLIFIVLQVWFDLELPDYMSEITKLVETEGSKMSDILQQGGYMLGCALGSMVCSMIVGYFSAVVAAGVSKTLRGNVYNRILGFSMKEIDSFSSASLINRNTNDITQIQNLIAMGMQAIIKAPILAVWAVTKIYGKSWQWSAATAIAVAVLVAALLITLIFAVPRYQRSQALTDKLNRITREQLTGIRVVRAYNAEAYQAAKFEDANEEITKNNRTANRVMSIMSPTMTLINSGLTLAVYMIGAYLIESAGAGMKLTIFSDMVVFSNYAMQIILAFMMLNMVFVLFPRAQVSARRINEVLDTETSVKDGTAVTRENAGAAGEKGVVQFKNVSFRYPGAGDDVISGIDFTARRGETVAVVGATGSGKSTLISLIPRFFDCTEGAVLVDGVDVRDYSQEALRDRIGYIPQKALLFSGTVASNISFGDNGRDADERSSTENIERAASISQSAEFIEKMEGAYDAEIAQGGANVSGGQRQRLTIARAIARDPEILVFDDSFSALDYQTDRKLRQELNENTPGVTKFIVAQRIGTIKDADQILVLDHGKIVGRGTHEELLESCDVYKEIALSQLSEEELAKTGA